MIWTLFLLGNHLEYQNKIHEELSMVFDDDTEPRGDEWQHLPYLNMAIKESMRLYPPVPVIIRKLSTDVTCGKLYGIISYLTSNMITNVSNISFYYYEKGIGTEYVLNTCTGNIQLDNIIMHTRIIMHVHI